VSQCTNLAKRAKCTRTEKNDLEKEVNDLDPPSQEQCQTKVQTQAKVTKIDKVFQVGSAHLKVSQFDYRYT